MKKMVFTFGRFNPPTTGHHLLANKVKAEAKKRSADYKIYGSSSQDKNKNPLSATDKYRFMKKILKGFNVSVDRNAKTPFVVLQKLSDEGYDEVTMVVGADRVSEFKKQISRYVGPDKDFKFSKFEVVSAGERDPDAEGVVGMSASKMRAAAKEGNFTAFRLGIPKHVSKNDAMGLFNAVRKGMGVRGKINESSWFDYDEYQEFANELNERKLTDKEKKSKQEIGDSLPDSEFRRKYSPPPRGPAKNWKEVKWATATKIAKGEGRGKKNEEMDLNEKWLQNLLRWNRARNLQAGQSQKASRLRKELQSKMSERGRVSREQDDAPLFGNRIATKVGKLSRGEDRLLSQVQRAERSAYRLGRIKAGKKPFGDDEIMKATKDNPTQGELDFVTDKKKRGMAEGLEQLDELSIQARRKLARRMKRTAKRRARVRKRKEKRRRTKTQLTAKAKKQAVMKVRQKLLRGMKWQDVPYLQREKIDAKVKKKKKRIAQIAKRLMPAMQKAEKERLDKVRKRMTTNDPAKAMSNNVNENFEQLINEVAPKYAMAQQRLIAKERDRGTGASTPQERDAARKRGTREAQQQGGKPKWSDLMMVTDTRDKVKLILAKDFDQSKHSVKVRKGKVTRGIAGTAANSPGWEWTETAKKLIKRKEDQPTQTAQPKVAMPKTPGSAGGAAGAGQQRPPMTPQEKQTAQANADLASLNAQEKEIQVGQLQKQVADEQEAEEQQKAAEAQKAEDDAMRQRQAALTKSSRDLLYPDSEHKAVDLEAGVVLALNQKNGVDPSAGLVSEKDQQLYQDSLTLNPAATRIIDQISEQLGPEYEAIHFGRATEPISGMWADYGGTDNTPKTDLMFKNRETGEVMRVSMKSGDGQLMSAKKGEAMATMKSIMQAHGDKIRAEKGTEKKINAIMKKMEKFVTTAETGMGAGPVGQFLKGKAKEGENPAVLLAEEMHQDVTDDFRDLLESSTAFKRALTRESMTGELKFGGCCPPDPNAVASATHMLSTKKDGTGAKLIPIDDDYVDNVAAGAKPKVAFKSSQKVASEGGKKVKTGSYSYWTAMRLLTSAAAFAGDAMQSGAQAMMESLLGMKDFIDLNEETKMNGREYLRKAKEWIGKDPEKMKEFLGIETESIETAEQDLSDLNTWESGQHTDIIINGKRKRLPVQKDLEYFDLEKEMTPLRGDMNEDFRLLTEPDVLDNLVNSLKKRGMENDKAYAIATSSLQKRGILKPGTHELAEYTATTPWQNQPAPAGALQKGLDWFTTSSWSPGTWLPDSWKKAIQSIPTIGDYRGQYDRAQRAVQRDFQPGKDKWKQSLKDNPNLAARVKRFESQPGTKGSSDYNKWANRRKSLPKFQPGNIMSGPLSPVPGTGTPGYLNKQSGGRYHKGQAIGPGRKPKRVPGVSPKTPKVPQFESYEFKNSPVDGMGSFATEKIEEGSMIGLYYLNLLEDTPSYQRTDFCRLTNHSCKNHNLRLENVDGNFYAVTTRDIKEGEELFVDYFHVFDTIVPELGTDGLVIEDVLRWTEGYESLEIGPDGMKDLTDELKYFIEIGDCPTYASFSEFNNGFLNENHASKADQREYLKKTVKQRSQRTMARRQAIRDGLVKLGDDKDIDHKDGNPMNNSKSNLRVMSRSKNRSRNNNKWRNEEHGAGEMGTKELLKKYLEDTPYMTIDDKFIKEMG